MENASSWHTKRINLHNVHCSSEHRGKPLSLSTRLKVSSDNHFPVNLPGLSITSLDHLLGKKAANCQTVPYLEYVEVKITSPRDFLGSDVEVSTLALVIPETGGTAQPKVLIGINTLGNTLFR